MISAASKTEDFWGWRGTAYINADINTLRPEQNGQYFADNILKCIFFNENVFIWTEISLLKFVSKCPIDNKSALI